MKRKKTPTPPIANCKLVAILAKSKSIIDDSIKPTALLSIIIFSFLAQTLATFHAVKSFTLRYNSKQAGINEIMLAKSIRRENGASRSEFVR